MLQFRPSGDHLENLARSARQNGVVTTTDNAALFDLTTCNRMRELSEDVLPIVALTQDVFAFDLTLLEQVTSSTPHHTRPVCGTCGLHSGVFPTSGPDDPIRLATRPKSGFVRSAEFFGLAYNRRPRVFIANREYDELRLSRNAYGVEVSN